MSVRKRTWTTGRGEIREAWIVDYADQQGERHIRTFDKKKEADAFHASVTVDVAAGTHTASSRSKTLEEAADLWIAACEPNLERATVDSYRQHLNLHILPYLGKLKLSELTTPLVRKFEDDLRAGQPAPGQIKGERRSPSMVKRVVISLGSMLADAQERGLVGQNVVRNLRAHRKTGKDRRAERRNGRLKVGVDIPSPEEIRTIVAHLDAGGAPCSSLPFLPA